MERDFQGRCNASQTFSPAICADNTGRPRNSIRSTGLEHQLDILLEAARKLTAKRIQIIRIGNIFCRGTRGKKPKPRNGEYLSSCLRVHKSRNDSVVLTV